MTGLFALWIAACAPSSPPVATPEPAEVAPAPDPDAVALEVATGSAKTLLGTLKARLVAVLGEAGPEAAAKVCADEAQALTASIAASSGAKVGRTSLRLRNPANAAPPWVQTWLTEQGERAAEGVAQVARIDDTPEGRMARVILPIAVAEPCVVCHGAAEAAPDPIRALLAERYPDDKAVGYAPGDLRGAAWAEVLVATASTPGGGER